MLISLIKIRARGPLPCVDIHDQYDEITRTGV